ATEQPEVIARTRNRATDPAGGGCQVHVDWLRMSPGAECVATFRGPKVTLSFVHGLDSEPLRFETVGQALDASVAKWGAHDALIARHQGIRWTYTELRQRADA